MIAGDVFWTEAVSVKTLLMTPTVDPVVREIGGVYDERGIDDPAGPRPYIEDSHGRRWLLDGSGEVA